MRIINAHVHMIELEGMLTKYPNLKLPSGISTLAGIGQTLSLLNVDHLLAQMDEAGIEKSVLFAVEAPIIYASNEYVASLCQGHPDRFIGLASVDPKQKDAATTLENAILNLGLKGLKFHPPLQDFFPNDKSIFPVYEKAAELNIPIVFHIGSTPFGPLCRLSQANPVLIDDVAVKFPKLRIMLTHLGTLWHNEAFMVVEKNPNVFIDTSAYLYEIPKLLTPELINRLGKDKIIFGTDYPMPYVDKPHRIKDFVDCIKGLSLSNDTKEKIFSFNLERFLKGTQEEKGDITVSEMSELLGKGRLG